MECSTSAAVLLSNSSSPSPASANLPEVITAEGDYHFCGVSDFCAYLSTLFFNDIITITSFIGSPSVLTSPQTPLPPPLSDHQPLPLLSSLRAHRQLTDDEVICSAIKFITTNLTYCAEGENSPTTTKTAATVCVCVFHCASTTTTATTFLLSPLSSSSSPASTSAATN